LPVNGSREALFAFAQTVVDATALNATVICPNPFYQIYLLDLPSDGKKGEVLR
jgi:N-succinyldiaminopimelate aminotransferase